MNIECICLDCGRKALLPTTTIGAFCNETGGNCKGSHMLPTYRGRIKMGIEKEPEISREEQESKLRQSKKMEDSKKHPYYCSPCGEVHSAGYRCEDYCGW